MASGNYSPISGSARSRTSPPSAKVSSITERNSARIQPRSFLWAMSVYEGMLISAPKGKKLNCTLLPLSPPPVGHHPIIVDPPVLTAEIVNLFSCSHCTLGT